MYLPKSFELTDSDLIAQIINDNSFGTLISNGDNGLQASHLPFDFDSQRGVLRCHMARANPQWRDFEGQEVLAIFQGAHGYISPRWYQTELAVPTWNYVAVHVYGKPTILEDDGEVVALLENLVAQQESQFETPWKLEAPADWQQKMRRAIVGFEMTITRIEAKAKMSQNRPAEDVEGVIAGLESKGDTPLAAWMRQFNHHEN
jgi:transcriptional regulator